jgi:hypothetical protein
MLHILPACNAYWYGPVRIPTTPNLKLNFTQVARAKEQAAHKRLPERHGPLERPKTLRDIENTPYRTFDRVQGQRPSPAPNFYLSEYMGSYGSHPRFKGQWGTWGSLKAAGPYLQTKSPVFNPTARQATGPGRWTPDQSALKSMC